VSKTEFVCFKVHFSRKFSTFKEQGPGPALVEGNTRSGTASVLQ